MTFLWILAVTCSALSAADQPASKPTTTTTAPHTSGDPEVDRILEQLEERGEDVHALACELRTDFLDVIAEDEQSKVGKLWFRRDKPNPKFKVVYERSLWGGVVNEDHHEYYFDGRWLIEKHDKSKTYIEREIVREGERIDPFRIGKGPFPLPFGQKKADILEHFRVTKVRRSPKDPRNTVHLKLIPREHSVKMSRKYAEVHFYIDKKLLLPVRVVAHQRRPGSKEVDEIITVTFTDMKVNAKVSDSVLQIEKPSGSEWHFSKEPLD